MWGPGWWGPPMWGPMAALWWIFPLIGLAIGLVFVIAMVRAMNRGGGFMCMGGHRGGGREDEDVAGLRREIRELRAEIKGLKVSR
jgi:hypothetical protein